MTSGVIGGSTFEMSRYIDLDIYHAVERSHPFYIEMMATLTEESGNFIKNIDNPRLLELGAGTGLATEDFLKHQNIDIITVDLDENCCNILHERKLPRVKTICGDATEYCEPGAFDLVASVFAHDHINHKNAAKFVANIHRNLKPGGIYLMGGEILPPYTTMAERRESLYAYHTFIVNMAMREENFELAQIEINALKSGLEMVGDFKRHEAMFEEEMITAPFELLKKIKLGPEVPDDIGGVFAYIYKAV